MAEKVFVDESLSGETIVGIEKDGRKWYLCSRYSDDAVAEGYVSHIKGVDEVSIFVMVGMANGSYIKKLAEKFPNNHILVYEPNEQLYEKVCAMPGNECLEQNEKIIIAPDMEFIVQSHRLLTNDLNYEYVEFCVSPNYDRLYAYECTKLEHRMMKRVQELVFYRNTRIRFSDNNAINLYRNIIDAYSHNTVVDLYEQIMKYNDRPAIIVAAGPSLDKNIEELKKSKNRAFIIAADSAVKTMIKHDILPDVLVTIDPAKSVRRFDEEKLQGVPLICDIFYNYRIRKVYNGQRFYSFNPEDYAGRKIDDRLGNYIDTGGSVANTAMSFLITAGFKNIAMVGQDLSYPDGKRYADNSAVYGDNKISGNSKRYYEVEAYDGGKVITENNMNLYREWIEATILEHEDIEFYDATEGGAMIHGAQNITLKEYNEKYCNSLEEENFEEVIKNIPGRFSEEEAKARTEEMILVKERVMDGLLEKIRECKRAYEEFNKLNLQGKYNSSRFVTVAQKIMELQGELETAEDMELAEGYNVLQMYRTGRHILEKKDNPYEENKDIYKNGIEFLNVQEEAVKMFLADYELVMEDIKNGNII